jgi:hypothetical protein
MRFKEIICILEKYFRKISSIIINKYSHATVDFIRDPHSWSVISIGRIGYNHFFHCNGLLLIAHFFGNMLHNHITVISRLISKFWGISRWLMISGSLRWILLISHGSRSGHQLICVSFTIAYVSFLHHKLWLGFHSVAWWVVHFSGLTLIRIWLAENYCSPSWCVLQGIHECANCFLSDRQWLGSSMFRSDGILQ